jgi:hypothetical protein
MLPYFTPQREKATLDPSSTLTGKNGKREKHKPSI